MKFDIYGPYQIPRGNKGTIIDGRKFWSDFENPKLARACGCYVFAISASGSYRPWYVGKTETTFKSEALHDNKIKIYNRVLDKRTKGIPVLFLLPLMANQGKFSKAKDPAILGLEDILISQAIARNPEAENSRGTKMLRGIEVVGFMNTSGRAKNSALALRKTFGMKKAFGS